MINDEHENFEVVDSYSITIESDDLDTPVVSTTISSFDQLNDVIEETFGEQNIADISYSLSIKNNKN